jgi:hypothetical protein
MKRRDTSSARETGGHDGSNRYRLIDEIPVVYLGPDALGALNRGSGVLLGAQRPGWVDALSFDAAQHGDWKTLVDRRFCGGGDLEPVGIVVSRADFRRLSESLSRELVPGDVVLAIAGGKKGKPAAYVNRGDVLALARLKISGAK